MLLSIQLGELYRECYSVFSFPGILYNLGIVPGILFNLRTLLYCLLFTNVDGRRGRIPRDVMIPASDQNQFFCLLRRISALLRGILYHPCPRTNTLICAPSRHHPLNQSIPITIITRSFILRVNIALQYTVVLGHMDNCFEQQLPNFITNEAGIGNLLSQRAKDVKNVYKT